VGLPRPGENANMAAMRATLAQTPSGRHVLEVYDRYGVHANFEPGHGGGFNRGSNTMTLDPGWGDFNNYAFVHEMNHAERAHEGRTANTVDNLRNMSRSDYVNGMLQEEAESDAVANQTAAERVAAGQHPT